VKILYRGLIPYVQALEEMRAFVKKRSEDTEDELWCLEHPSVFTLGQRAERQYLLDPRDIPVIPSCRGGHVTYHGPGQSVFYPLLNLKKNLLGIKQLRFFLEEALLQTLIQLKIPKGHRQEGAPGVYVEGKKIASIGLRIRQHYSYHGLSVNIKMDMEPFTRIVPCGIKDIRMCQIADFIPAINPHTVEILIANTFLSLVKEAAHEPAGIV
jgi:lipoyl(octanoyl) transferase